MTTHVHMQQKIIQKVLLGILLTASMASTKSVFTPEQKKNLNYGCQPEQAYLTYGDLFTSATFTQEHQYTVGFVLKEKCIFPPKVVFKNMATQEKLTFPVVSTSKYHNDQLSYTSFSNYVVIKGLAPRTHYQYSIETSVAENSLGPFDLTTPKFFPKSHQNSQNPADVYESYLIISDMDISTASQATVSAIKSLDMSKFTGGFIHLGDFAYDINEENGMKGDCYFQTLMPVQTRAPTIYIPGNHENFDKARLFNFRFRMPNPLGDAGYSQFANNYFSFQKANAHFTTVNVDFILTLDPHNQFNRSIQWLEDDLKKARADPNIKWIIFLSHRGIYCSDVPNTEDCEVNLFYLKPIYDLLRKYKADLILSSHEHFYERRTPLDMLAPVEVDEEKLDIGTSYYSPTVPIEVLQGCAGNAEIFPERGPLSATTEFTMFKTQCYMTLDQSNDRLHVRLFQSQDGLLRDQVIIIKEQKTLAAQINAELNTLIQTNFFYALGIFLSFALVFFVIYRWNYRLDAGLKEEKAQKCPKFGSKVNNGDRPGKLIASI